MHEVSNVKQFIMVYLPSQMMTGGHGFPSSHDDLESYWCLEPGPICPTAHKVCNRGAHIGNWNTPQIEKVLELNLRFLSSEDSFTNDLLKF